MWEKPKQRIQLKEVHGSAPYEYEVLAWNAKPHLYVHYKIQKSFKTKAQALRFIKAYMMKKH